MEKLTLGIDDAGRGPVIGPMILSGVILTKEQEVFLKKEGVADSKTLSHKDRVKLAQLIIQHSEGHHIEILEASQIDAALNSGTNLNTLEAQAMARIINAISKPEMQVVIDCPSVNINAWRNTLISFVNNSKELDIKCEHKADANHVCVSAASILGKVRREDEVTRLKEKYGKIGSGYPSDPDTVLFLKENGAKLKDSGLFRTTWATYTNLFGGGSKSKDKQVKLF